MPCDQTTATLAHYARHATDFASSTVDVYFRATQERFTSPLEPKAAILDLGCGSGGDAKRFLDEGLSVTAIDGSPEPCAIAHGLTGIPIRNELFGDLTDANAYDGIWACSPILRQPKDGLTDAPARMARALRPHGVVHASFKHGNFEGMRNGRHFTDSTEPAFRGSLLRAPGHAVEDLWISSDISPARESEQWLNPILRKKQKSAMAAGLARFSRPPTAKLKARRAPSVHDLQGTPHFPR